MKLLHLKNIIVIVIVFLFSSRAIAQTQNMNLEERALQALAFAKTLDQFSDNHAEPTRISHAFLSAVEALAEDSSLDVVAESLLSFPIMNIRHEYSRISVCGITSNNSLIRDYINRQFHSSDSIAVLKAARVLLKWGYYDESIPVILNRKKYIFIENNMIENMTEDNKQQILSRIRHVNALKDHTWREKLHAAIIAYRLGVTDQLPMIVEEVLAKAPLEDKEEAISQCKFEALELMLKYDYNNNIKYLPRLANDNNRMVRMHVVACANYYAQKGNNEATEVLRDISKNANDQRLRETARGYLENLER